MRRLVLTTLALSLTALGFAPAPAVAADFTAFRVSCAKGGAFLHAAEQLVDRAGQLCEQRTVEDRGERGEVGCVRAVVASACVGRSFDGVAPHARLD